MDSSTCTRLLTCFAQVMSFAESLQDNEGKPLVRSARIASSIPLPQDVPDLVVATPAGLMNATTDLGPYAGWEWTKLGIVSRYVLLRAGQDMKDPGGVLRGPASMHA